MSEKTATHVDYDLDELAPTRPRRVGLVGVFSEADTELVAMAVAGPVRAGREQGVECWLNDPKASRQHAVFEPAGQGVSVTNLGSHNGTWVDGVPIGAGTVLVMPGATIRIGRTLLRVVSDVDAWLQQRTPFGPPLIGGPGMADVRRQLSILARGSAPVLIHGETGSGKERAAELVHQASGRRGSYVTINCAAIPSELVESELFGHSRGAFSGSQKSRQGLFRSAEGGTLLLDELGELPLGAQAKLLRVVEDGEVRPVGEDAPVLVDVRIIAATNRNLQAEVAQGRFREDLMHRLAAGTVTLPPLRERVEDVPLLAAHFLADTGVGFTVAAMERLLLDRWPGNVRQLRNVVLAAANAARLSDHERIQADDLPPELRQRPSARGARAPYGSDPYATEPSGHALAAYVAPGGGPAPAVSGYGASAAASALGGSAGGGAAYAYEPSAVGAPIRRQGDEELHARIVTALQLRRGNVAQVSRDLDMRRAGLYEAFARLGIDPAAYRGRR